MNRVIELHVRAPGKPALNAPCNGCGACCALEPCPVAWALLLQFRGACRALLWKDDAQRYECGMVVAPARMLPWLPLRLAAWVGRLCARQVALGSGCDADIEMDS